jgi:hypothetical protein
VYRTNATQVRGSKKLATTSTIFFRITCPSNLQAHRNACCVRSVLTLAQANR